MGCYGLYVLTVLQGMLSLRLAKDLERLGDNTGPPEEGQLLGVERIFKHASAIILSFFCFQIFPPFGAGQIIGLQLETIGTTHCGGVTLRRGYGYCLKFAA